MNPEAEELNKILQEKAPAVYRSLSSWGKQLFFPSKGILSQTAEAKGATYNATIGQAFEDDGSPMVLDVITQQGISPKSVLYSPSPGQPQLRELWKKEVLRKNPSLKGTITSPLITQALTHGLSVVYDLFIDKEDKIIIPDQYWENLDLTFKGAEYNMFTLFKNGGFNVQGLKEKLQEKGKKIVILNFPNNPTGYTPTVQEANEITRVLKEAAESGSNIVVVLDDAYFGLVYEEGVYEESLFAKLADVHENLLAVKVDGMTKESFVWGLRVGFITYGLKNMDEQVVKALEAKTGGCIRGQISSTSTVSQNLSLKALESPEYGAQREEKAVILKERYQVVKKTLAEHPEYNEEFEALPYNSGYFMCVCLKKMNADELRKKLITDFSTGLIALGNDIIRVAYSASSKENIPVIFENIYKACKS